MFLWGTGMMLLGLSMGVPAHAAAPDISGIWVRDAGPPEEAPPLRPAYVKAAESSRALQAKADAAQRSIPPASVTCRLEGMPTVMGARRALEILQTPGQITVLAEYMTQTRRIYLDEALPALDDVNPGYMGYSVAKWQGNTLDVQTIGVRDDVRYLGIPHTDQMKILEKIHLTAPNALQDEVTIVDPRILTRPYRVIFDYKKDPGHRIMEWPCNHNTLAAK
jgi:hypothetical protein